jgi:hypothetical protein
MLSITISARTRELLTEFRSSTWTDFGSTQPNRSSEIIQVVGGEAHRVGGTERSAERLQVHGVPYFRDFHLEWGLPTWRYELGPITLEKQILMPHRQNSVHVHYSLVSGDVPVRLKLRLALDFRSHDASVPATTGLRIGVATR